MKHYLCWQPRVSAGKVKRRGGDGEGVERRGGEGKRGHGIKGRGGGGMDRERGGGEKIY